MSSSSARTATLLYQTSSLPHLVKPARRILSPSTTLANRGIAATRHPRRRFGDASPWDGGCPVGRGDSGRFPIRSGVAGGPSRCTRVRATGCATQEGGDVKLPPRRRHSHHRLLSGLRRSSCSRLLLPQRFPARPDPPPRPQRRPHPRHRSGRALGGCRPWVGPGPRRTARHSAACSRMLEASRKPRPPPVPLSRSSLPRLRSLAGSRASEERSLGSSLHPRDPRGGLLEETGTRGGGSPLQRRRRPPPPEVRHRAPAWRTEAPVEVHVGEPLGQHPARSP